MLCSQVGARGPRASGSELLGARASLPTLFPPLASRSALVHHQDTKPGRSTKNFSPQRAQRYFLWRHALLARTPAPQHCHTEPFALLSACPERSEGINSAKQLVTHGSLP